MKLFTFLALPNLFFMLFQMDSMAIPLLIALLIVLPMYYMQISEIEVSASTIVTISIIFLYLVFEFYGSGNNYINQKPILSFVLIILLYFLTFAMIASIKNINLNFSHGYFAILIVGIFGLLDIQPSFSRYYNNPVFPFDEPSHFNLAYGVISTACMQKYKKNKIYIPAVTAIFGVIFPSLSMIVLAFMQIALIIKLRNFIPVIILIGLSIAFLNLSYFSARIGGQEKNASFLVYMQGWESIYETYLNLRIFGLGFQQMGFLETTPIGEFLCNVYSFCSNNYDGSFLLSKLITEFGTIGLLFGIILTYYSFCSMLQIRKNLKIETNQSDYIILGYSFIYISLIELYIRGYGYFSINLLSTIIFIQSYKALKKS